jgi:chorismate synthase
MKIILTGPKGCGKTTLGAAVAKQLGIPFIETDSLLEELHEASCGKRMTCRHIYNERGEEYFRALEKRAIEEACSRDWCLLSTGGGTFQDPDNRRLLREKSIMVLLRAPDDLLWERLSALGLPSFFSGDRGFEKMKERNERLYETMTPMADIILDIDRESEQDAHLRIAEQISAFFMLGMNSPNTFGEIIRVTTFGESHGRGLGAVMDGVAPGIPISEEDIQAELNRRRPGQSRVTTPRDEKDRVHFLSGVFEGKTTGTPICMVVYNEDQDSGRYEALRDLFRPGHADFTFWKKYGIRDHRGGGRSSGRETIGRVAAGAIAKKILRHRGIEITAYSEMIAGIRGDLEDFSVIENNAVRAADPVKAAEMEAAIVEAQKNRDSVGGTVKCIIGGCPAGLGDPVFFKLDARLAMAMFSLGAVKGVEIGAGFAAASMSGSENNDAMRDGKFLSNNAGGILGGISTGADITLRIAVKPTPSIAREQQTIDILGHDRTIIVEGRHDPCIVPRIVPVVESMAALVILDALRMQENLRNNK